MKETPAALDRTALRERGSHTGPPVDATPADLTDAMIEQARAGDRAALEALLTALRPRVLMVARRQLMGSHGVQELAEDITQDTLVRVVLHLDSCRAQSVGQLIAWAHVIARRRICDERRRHLGTLDPARYGLPVGASLAPVGYEQLTTVAEEIAARTPLDDARLAAVFIAYERLEPTTAELVWLRVVRDAGWPEIADALHTTAGAAKRRYQRAIARMQRYALEHLHVGPTLPCNAPTTHRSGGPLPTTERV